MLRRIACCAGFLLLPLPAVSWSADAAHETALITIGNNLDLKHAEKRDVDARVAGPAECSVLALKFGHRDPWPSIVFCGPGPGWDLTAAGYVVAEVKNVGPTSVRIGCRLDSAGSNKNHPPAQASHDLLPGQSAVLRVPLSRKLPAALKDKLFGMRGFPGGYSDKDGIDPARVTRLRIFAAQPTSDSSIEVLYVRAAGTPPPRLPVDPAKMFPMIDALGQYQHADWAGKTHSVDDLPRQRIAEAAEIQQHPAPADWDIYGGWKSGPQLPATGFFYPHKHEGRWWLVDPEGRLFWSHGITGVRSESSTPITDRRHWFAELPEPGTPLARLVGHSNWAPHGYYQGKSYDTFDFYGVNLRRKYGDGWHAAFVDTVHQRLHSWGLNTIANWSEERVYLARKTPYVVAIHTWSKPLAGSTGYWGQFADVFDASFPAGLHKSLAREQGRSAGDPWCLGYFIDNELGWGDEVSLALAAVASPPEQAAKLALLDDLKAKYATIDGLNRAWGTAHASWPAWLECRNVPDKKKAHDDLAAFYTRTAEQYFRLCREAVKAAAPRNLYLGCRFAWINDRAVQASAKFCDVLSYNLYRDSVVDFRLPQGIDLPVVIGEFHFGALDRGMFHTGLRPVADQAARAEAYRNYVRGALQNPCLVGTHWFQWVDQPTTGRGDGENYQIGFVDTCDTPYAETIAACREVAKSLYRTRWGK